MDDMVRMASRGAPELLARFIGFTPHLEARDRPQGTIAQREEEINAWQAMNGQKGWRWLALDDNASNFAPGRDGLYLVDWQTGVVEEDVHEVLEILR